MPSNLLKLSSSIMESGFHNRSDFERSGSFDSQSSQCSRSRSSHFDDENLKYLTNEEKNALMFLEETLDAFEDEPEEPPLSANSSLGYYSPRSTEDSHSDTDDIIDLVETDHNHVEISPEDSGIGLGSTNWNLTKKDSWTSQSPTTVSSPVTIPLKETENLSPDLSSEQRKLHGAIPTPVIIAQKMFEKRRESGNLSPMSPKDEKSPELKKSVGTSPISEGHFIFPGSPNTKPSRFPNNIIIKQVGKQYNKTIAKAAVNVQERKAQVLAHLHGPGWFADEIDATNRHEQVGRRTSFREVPSEQTRYEALVKLGLVKEIPVQADVGKSPVSNGEHSVTMLPPETSRRHSNENESISKILMNEPSAFVPLGKTVVIKGEPGTSIERNKRPSSVHIAQEKTQINTNQEIKRTYSMARPTGLWSQGITVQFSGRDSSEDSRKDALRRLGLLSGH
ncbi:proline and serine-rich protein 2 isoform X3 [Bufo bufo]|uniref:proline and serine-rich protein 2 isoform X2 n=1 Tax=Bufo bufo TaxID=8384 RepID=UPI001ABEB267|nr:proline and serine-rich protein 2 isoform X2 [Bufo bufo]XP_040269154.1 proline and serine-rich protein 2 isoform X3 [Bufo bufo]